jgi:hypothetical protein
MGALAPLSIGMFYIASQSAFKRTYSSRSTAHKYKRIGYLMKIFIDVHWQTSLLSIWSENFKLNSDSFVYF